MGKSKFSIEFKKEVCEYTNDHNYAQAHAKFGVTNRTIQIWRNSLGYPQLGRGVRKSAMKDLDFKHEVCQYYDNHTAKETLAKFDVCGRSLFKWRRELGYRNKSRGYNLYTQEYRQQSRAPLNFKSVRGEDGKYTVELLQKRITDLETKIATMQPDVELAQSIRNLFN